MVRRRGRQSRRFTNTSREWELEIRGNNHTDGNVQWDVAATGGTADVTITPDELRAATAVIVQSVQGTVTDDNPWKSSDEASVTPES